MISVDCVTGIPFFIHVNVSGGEPDEIQVNVILEPRTISIGDNDDDDDIASVITGAAVWVNVYNK